jgi:predicted RNA-binding Zn ribbon-like protein
MERKPLRISCCGMMAQDPAGTSRAAGERRSAVTVSDVPDLYPSEPLPVRFMNTVWADRDGVHDALGTVAQLQQWAHQCGVPLPTRLTRADLDLARSLRDALRRLAAAQLDDDRAGAVADTLTTEEALVVVNDLLATCVPEVRAGGSSGLARDWRSSLSGFGPQLATLALEASDLLTEGTTAIGACHGPGCVLYFRRLPARREWCSAGCGNRARVARHYQRRHSGS